MLWALRPRTLPANRRAPDCETSPMCVRESCSAGHSPNSTPVPSATVTLKTRTGMLIRITASEAKVFSSTRRNVNTRAP